MPDRTPSESDLRPSSDTAGPSAPPSGDPRVIEELVRTLSLRDRLIVCLRFADGLTVAEIAAVLALPPTDVESVLARTVDQARMTIASLADAA